MALLALEDVHTYYGEAHILQGVSLRLEDGEAVTLIGRNGAGKTTTLRSIMGIARPSRVRINLRGTTLLLVEQTLEVALALSHRLYVMDQGRIQFEGTPDALRQDPTIQQRFLEV